MPINNDGTLSTEWTDVSVLLDGNGGIVQIVDTNFEGLTRPGSGTDVTIGSLTTGTITINQNTYRHFLSEVVAANNLEIFSGRTLSANASMMTIHGNVTNNGNFNINTDNVRINGDIANAGTITISAESVGGNNSSVLRLAGTTSLTGSGDLRLIGSGTQWAGRDISAELTGADPNSIAFLENASRISGQGIIGFNRNQGDPGGVLILHNLAGGVIDANRTTGPLMIYNDGVTAANPTTNAGTMQATSGGRLHIQAPVLEQSASGLIRADGNGSRVDLWDTAVRGGVLTTLNGGLIQAMNTGATLDGSTPAGSVTLTTGTRLETGSQTTLRGAIVNQGTILQNGYASVLRIGAEGVTLTGGGDISLSYNGAAIGYFGGALIHTDVFDTPTLLNNVNNHFHGAGAIGYRSNGAYQGYTNSQINLVNQASGMFSADIAGQTLYLQGLHTFSNAGTLRAVNGGTLRLVNGYTDNTSTTNTIQNLGGTIYADGAGSEVVIQGYSSSNPAARMTINGGSLSGVNGGIIRLVSEEAVLDGSTNQGAVSLSGAITVDRGAFRGAINNAGNVTLGTSDGTLYIVTQGATLSGFGTVTMNAATDRIIGVYQNTGAYGPELNTPATLTNTNNTIAGGGFIGSSGGGWLSFINQSEGTVRATLGQTLILSTQYTIVNNGVLESTGGTLDIRDQVSGTGQVRVSNGGILAVRNDIAQDIHFVGAGDETLVFQPIFVNFEHVPYANVIRGMEAGDRVRFSNDFFAAGDAVEANPYSFNWTVNNNGTATLSYTISGSGGTTSTYTFDDQVQGHFMLTWESVGNQFGSVVGVLRVASIDGDGSANTLVGTAGRDSLIGFGGDDILRGGRGDDLLDGGAGYDLADYSDALGGVAIQLGYQQGYGQDVGGAMGRDAFRSIEGVIGSNFNDTFLGTSNNDRFDGGGGDDTFDSYGGVDIINGGSGTDVLQLQSLLDANFQPLNLTVTLDENGNGSADYGANGSVTFTGIEGLIGAQSNDILIGNSQSNILSNAYGGGTDTLTGGGGDDLFRIGYGRVTITDFNVASTIEQIDVSNRFFGSFSELMQDARQDGADVVWGVDGNDRNLFVLRNVQLSTLTAADFIYYVSPSQIFGTNGDDTLNGTTRVDQISGAEGNDTINASDSNDIIDGGAHNDTIDGGAGNDRINAGNGDDTVYYDAADDFWNVFGGIGTDTLVVIGGSAPTSFGLVAQGFEGARHEQSDTANTVAWNTITDTYNATWQVLTSNRINDNGTRVLTTYDRGALVWSSIVESFNAANGRTEQQQYNDDGSRKVDYWDLLSTQSWTSLVEEYNTGGSRTLQRIYNDDGSYRFFYWDPATPGFGNGVQTWTTFDDEFNAAGQRHTERLTYDTGTFRNFYWDVTNTQSWVTFDEEYTGGPASTRSIQRIQNDDGTTSQQFWDTDSSQTYSTYVDYMNAAGQRTEQRIFHDQGGNAGGYTRVYYDPTNAQPWSTQTDVYNAAGVLISTTQVPG